MRFFPLDIERYRHAPSLQTRTEVEEIGRLLAGLGAEFVPWEPDAEARDHDRIMERLDAWAASEHDAFLYWIGHGESNGAQARLLLPESRPGHDLRALLPEQMADQIIRRERNVKKALSIIVIEACGSADFALLTLSSLLIEALRYGAVPRFLIFGTSGEGATHPGVFRKALQAVVPAFQASERIVLRDLRNQLKDRLPEAVGWCDPSDDLVLRRSTLTSPATLEVRAEIDRLPPSIRAHFLTKAKGSDLNELTWYFSGRSAERADIASWLRRERGMLIVTGAPGSGKSALLGDAVLQSRSALRDVLVRAGIIASVPERDRPPDNAFDAVIHLTGLRAAEMVDQLATALGLGVPTGVPVGRRAERLLAELGDRPATILVDALDEAQEPLVLARLVLRPLAALPHVSLVVGTRRSTGERLDRQVPGGADLLGELGPATVLTVTRDPAALTAYLRRRLTRAVELGALRTGQSARINEAAALIGASGPEPDHPESFGFLFAHLSVHEILARPELLTDGGLPELTMEGHGRLFERAVERLVGIDPVFDKALWALALKQGRGLPMLDRVWSAVTAAVTGTAVTAEQIDRLRENAGPYLIADSEAGQTVFRLANETYAEHFLARRGDHHTAIVRELVDLVEGETASRLNPYVESHLAGHAAEAGPDGWALLARRHFVLDRISPSSVVAALRSVFSGLPAEIAAVLGASHLLEPLPTADRAGIRHLAMARHAGVIRPAAHGGSDDHASWSVEWAVVRHHPPHLTFTDRGGEVRAMTALTGTDRRALLAAGNAEGDVWIWGADAGTPLHRFSAHSGGVATMTALPDDAGPDLLSTGGADGTIAIWEPATAEHIRRLPGHLGGVLAAVALPRRGRSPLLASGGADGRVRVWDPGDGSLHRELSGHRGDVLCAAVLRRPGLRPLLASGGGDGTVRLWDVGAGQEVAGFAAHTGGIRTMAALPRGDGPDLLVTGGTDQTVRIWNPLTGRLVRALAGHTGSVLSTAVLYRRDRGTLLATGGTDQTIRLWNPGNGEPVSHFTGHSGRISAMTPLPTRAGPVLLATGGSDRSARAWDPDTPQPSHQNAGVVLATAAYPAPDGRTALLSAGTDGAVDLWDASSERPFGRLFGHTGRINVMLMLPGPDGRPLLATGGSDGSVLVRDPADRETPLRLVHGIGWVNAMTAVPMDGRSMLAVGGTDDHIRLWSPGTAQPHRAVERMGVVSAMAVLPSGDGAARLVTGETDGTLHLWDLGRGRLMDELFSHPSGIRTISVLPSADLAGGGTIMAIGTADGTVLLYEPATRRILHRLTGHSQWINTVAWSPSSDGRPLLVTGGNDRSLRVWDPRHGTLLHQMDLSSEINSCTPLGGGRMAVGLNEGLVVIALAPGGFRPGDPLPFRGA